MDKKMIDKAYVRILGVSMIVLAEFGVWLCCGIFVNNVPVSVIRSGIETPLSAKSADPHSEVSATTAGLTVPINIGLPVRIRIPRIAVDAAVEKVALAADGSMGVPKHPLDAAWYALGPRPGETGNAAIAGHVDWVNGSAAVFANLHKVRAGDKIAVQDDNGAVTFFVVRESRRYDAEADAVDVFISNDGKAHLNIITCDGTLDKRTGQYSKRLVVFADKEADK